MSLLKPGLKTPFHIDFEWWQKNERDWQVFLRSLLCPEHQELFADVEGGQVVDWIDENTAEVRPVQGLQHALMSSVPSWRTETRHFLSRDLRRG